MQLWVENKYLDQKRSVNTSRKKMLLEDYKKACDEYPWEEGEQDINGVCPPCVHA